MWPDYAQIVDPPGMVTMDGQVYTWKAYTEAIDGAEWAKDSDEN